jgi:hypothetical protein
LHIKSTRTIVTARSFGLRHWERTGLRHSEPVLVVNREMHSPCGFRRRYTLFTRASLVSNILGQLTHRSKKTIASLAFESMNFNPCLLFVALPTDFSTIFQHDCNRRRPGILQKDPMQGNLPLRHLRKFHEVGNYISRRGRLPCIGSSWRRR